MIRVYNTLSKQKEPFEPVQPPKVGIYLCGPTVYKPSHIGHMVGPVIFDCIKRYLAYNGYDVTLVVNVTDVDDKLIAESNKRGMPMAELAREMTADYMENIAALGVDTIDHFPYCTDHMRHIIELVERLIERGFAYESDGDVYFDVTKDDDYGKLSHRQVEALAGEGGEMVGRKRNPADFALWKSAKPDEPSWESPWGPGRPGWHIECSAMSHAILGETLDIHGGGLDLVFPHHENEIAQSEAASGTSFAKYWMHNGLMQASSELGKVGGRQTRAKQGDLTSQEAGKISKSKGASAFKEMLAAFSGETIRFFLLSTHYRRPIDFSEERIREVETGLEAFYRFFERFQRVTGQSFYDVSAATRRDQGELDPGDDPLLQQVAEQRVRFLEAMDDDFNTAGGIAALFDLVRLLNKYVDQQGLEDPKKRDQSHLDSLRRGSATLRELGMTLGLFREAPAAESAGGDMELVGKLMDLLIEVRTNARKNKDFATADQIRDQLAEMGVTLEDRPSGTEWSID